MKIQLLREDGSEVNQTALSEKIVQKLNEDNSDEAVLCMHMSLNLFNGLRHIPLLGALATLSQEIPRVLAIFFRAGYILSQAVDKNSLTINVQREDDDSNHTDTQSNTTHNSSNSS